MNPKDFLSLAKTLKDIKTDNEEAMLRTIIGRAYYSSFLILKEFTISLGEFHLREYQREGHPAPGKIHAEVRDSLHNCRFPHLADQLYSLFEKRVIADYQINNIITIGDVNQALQLSQRIEAFLDLHM